MTQTRHGGGTTPKPKGGGAARGGCFRVASPNLHRKIPRNRSSKNLWLTTIPAAILASSLFAKEPKVDIRLSAHRGKMKMGETKRSTPCSIPLSAYPCNNGTPR